MSWRNYHPQKRGSRDREMEKMANMGLRRLEEMEFRKSKNISSHQLCNREAGYIWYRIKNEQNGEQGFNKIACCSLLPRTQPRSLYSCRMFLGASEIKSLKVHFDEVSKVHLVSRIWPRLAAFYNLIFWVFLTLMKANYSVL